MLKKNNNKTELSIWIEFLVGIFIISSVLLSNGTGSLNWSLVATLGLLFAGIGLFRMYKKQIFESQIGKAIGIGLGCIALVLYFVAIIDSFNPKSELQSKRGIPRKFNIEYKEGKELLFIHADFRYHSLKLEIDKFNDFSFDSLRVQLDNRFVVPFDMKKQCLTYSDTSICGLSNTFFLENRARMNQERKFVYSINFKKKVNPSKGPFSIFFYSLKDSVWECRELNLELDETTKNYVVHSQRYY